MNTNYTWHNNILCNSFEIIKGNEKVGLIKSDLFNQTTKTSLNNENYIFVIRDFLNQYTEIRDDENKLIGTINHNLMANSAKIKLGESTYFWRFKNIWCTKWVIFDENNQSIDFNNGRNSIESNLQNNLLVLVGLYIFNQYFQNFFAMLIIFFVLFTIII